MSRPPSIIAFERLYLASLALYLVNAAAFWSQTREVMNQAPQVQASAQLAAMVGPIMIGSLIVTAAVTLLFWYLVARQGSVAGKWLVIVTEAIGAAFGAFALVRLIGGNSANPTSVTLGLASTLLAIAAAVMLVRPDARAWLGTGDGTMDEPA